MALKSYGFGIVGAGMIARVHAKAISEIAGARLVGVYSPTIPKATAFAQAHHCVAFESLQVLATHDDIDIVCICSPSGFHEEPVIACIREGKHCLIEKPLEVTLAKCDHILAEAEKAKVKVGVIFQSRFNESTRQLKQALESERFGDLVLGDAYVKWYRSPEYYQSASWRGTWERDGGGALMNQGIHTVDLLQWYMGPVTAVHAMSGNIRHKNIEVEDTIVATLHFGNGALGSLECSTAVFPGTFKKIEIMGTSGSAILEESKLVKWDFIHHRPEDELIKAQMLKNETLKGGVSDPADITYLGHKLQIEDMIQAVADNRQPLINGEEGRKSVAIVIAAYESARLDKTVRVG